MRVRPNLQPSVTATRTELRVGHLDMGLEGVGMLFTPHSLRSHPLDPSPMPGPTLGATRSSRGEAQEGGRGEAQEGATSRK